MIRRLVTLINAASQAANHLIHHASYIGGWLKALGDNPSAYLTSASKAQTAADWMFGEERVG